MPIYSQMPLSYEPGHDTAKLNAYKSDLTPDGERTYPCVNHPERRAVALDAGQPLCMPCWRERRTQGAITRDVDAIKRASNLDPHERMILLRRAERGKS